MRATIFTTTDRVEAQALLSLLRGAGLDAELVGVVDAARLGVGEGALPLRLEVAAEDEAEARELLAARPVPQPETEDEAPESSPPRLGAKRPIIALGVPVVWPGLGHVYAARPFTGVTLMLGVLLSFFAAAGYGGFSAVYVLLFFLDAFFGRRAVLAFNAGRHVGPAKQLFAGVAMVVAAFAVVGAPLALDAYERARQRSELARVELRCEPGRLTLRNVGDAARDVEVTSVVTAQVMSLLANTDVQGVKWGAPARQVLAPQADLSVVVDWPEPGALLAVPGVAPLPRTLQVGVVVRREAGEPGVRGTFSCVPRGS
jgi:hypothetical protein